MVIDLPSASPGVAYLPSSYGYIGLTSVDPRVRGIGVGSALVHAAKEWFRAHELDDILLHFIDDNDLSRNFWQGKGFSPVVVTLAGDVL